MSLAKIRNLCYKVKMQADQTETEMWIGKLERAMAAGRRLKPVSMQERAMVTALMVAAGRSDLAMETYRLLPTLAGGGQSQNLRQVVEEADISTPLTSAPKNEPP